MTTIRMPAHPGCFAAVAVAACLASTMPARAADTEVPLGTWSGEVRDTANDPKDQATETIYPVKFDWRTTDVERASNALRYFGTRSCALSAQYVGHGRDGYQFVLKAPPGGHCDKADRAYLRPEGNGLHLTVSSDDGKKLHEEGTLMPDNPGATPAAR